jgi:hypothetical protein
MTDFHPHQEQHRIPRTYLKNWAFLKDKISCLTIFDCLLNEVQDIEVNKFTVAINEFDLPSEDPIERRHYETTAGKVEGWYTMVLNSIESQNKLTERHEDILRHFISLLHCRSEVVREEFCLLLDDQFSREKFIKEVMILRKEGEPTPEDILLALSAVPKNKRLNLITGAITNHYSRVFRAFSAIILKPSGNIKWLTTDLPVYFDKQENFNYLVSWDSEIYFPLSPDYCLFLFHKKSTLNRNSLRMAVPNRVHLLNDEEVDAINRKLLNDAYRFLVIPQEYKEGFIEELERIKSEKADKSVG